VERDDPGFSVTKKLKKLGKPFFGYGRVGLRRLLRSQREDAGRPDRRRIGPAGKTLKSGRITYGARSTGVGQAAFEATLSFVKENRRHGQALGKSQRFDSSWRKWR